MRKGLLRRYGAFGASLFVCALGIGLITNANLGHRPSRACPTWPRASSG
ncbi:MAG: hypothetical protein V8Q84_03235 [Bilophila sp.]